MRDERGAATVLAVAMASVLLLLGLVGSWATAAFARHRVAQSAADLAALAAASAVQRGEDACGAAGRLASSNRVRLSACRLDGDDVWVTVSVEAPPLWGWTATLDGRARAGPSP